VGGVAVAIGVGVGVKVVVMIVVIVIVVVVVVVVVIRRPLPCQGSLAVRASVEVKESSGRDQLQ